MSLDCENPTETTYGNYSIQNDLKVQRKDRYNKNIPVIHYKLRYIHSFFLN